MTLATDVTKIRSDLDRMINVAETNAQKISVHEQQISGDRGITETLAQLSSELKTVHKDLTTLGEKVSALEKAFAEWVAVAKALAEKGVTTRQFTIGVIGLLIPIIILFVTASHHS